ncbi:MAG: alkaline phosphatase family protein [Aestuariibacter sp.]
MRFGLLLTSLIAAASCFAQEPKLILQITVDQLRGDLLHRYEDSFVDGKYPGFKQFLDRGTLYTNTHYRHAATLTAVGHATLATGAIPAHHGLIANNWYDATNNKSMYCVADAETKILHGKGYSASPANLTASTFSDQLHMASNGKAKIYSVSVKDRGAILTGGHFGKSFWYDKKVGDFVTSSYYYDEMPAWLTEFNTSGLKDKYVGSNWSMLYEEDKYHNDLANQMFQIPPRGFSRGFPHGLPKQSGPDYYAALALTPYADTLTAQLAKKIVSEHALGKDNITDYLAVSFSIADYVGHNYGPNSRESEDNLYHLDQTLSGLFQFIDEHVGLDNTLIVLSADHGVDAIPEYKKSLGFAAFRGDVSKRIEDFAQELQQEYGLDESPLLSAIMPNIYLNHQALAQAGVNKSAIEQRLYDFVAAQPELSRVFKKHTLLTQNASDDDIASKVKNNLMPDRSGDFVVVQKTSAMTGNYASATHGSPYNYDTFVPMYFTGWKVKSRKVTARTSPEDVAVTLSALLGIGYPDRATGQVLDEIAGLK